MSELFYNVSMKRGEIMNERLKLLRKELGLTQTQFGERIGVKGNTITTYETGVRVPPDSIVHSICREFYVNENWLRTGEGSMFLKLSDNADLIYIFTEIEYSDDQFIKDFITVYWRLPDDQKAGIKALIHGLLDQQKSED